MPDAYDEHNNLSIFYRADYPVRTDSIFPKTLEVFTQRVTEAAGVVIRRYLVPHESNDGTLGPGIQLFELFDCLVFPFNLWIPCSLLQGDLIFRFAPLTVIGVQHPLRGQSSQSLPAQRLASLVVLDTLLLAAG